MRDPHRRVHCEGGQGAPSGFVGNIARTFVLSQACLVGQTFSCRAGAWGSFTQSAMPPGTARWSHPCSKKISSLWFHTCSMDLRVSVNVRKLAEDAFSLVIFTEAVGQSPDITNAAMREDARPLASQVAAHPTGRRRIPHTSASSAGERRTLMIHSFWDLQG